MLTGLRKRLPDSQAILQVYAVIAVLFSAWTITAFLWKLSAWLLLLNLGEIFAIFSYAMAVNLLESLLILMLLLVLSVVLPARFLQQDFAVRGTALSLGMIGSLMAFLGLHMAFATSIVGQLAIVLFEILLLMLVFAALSPRFTALHSILLRISDRMLVFLYILLPLFVVLLLYVIYRNIA